MVKITSREELEQWLEDKPRDWARVIAARVALRALPYAFDRYVTAGWIAKDSLMLFRATVIAWAARSFPACNMAAAAKAANAASTANLPNNAAKVANAANLAVYAANVARAAADASVWTTISHDCNWLESAGDGDASRRLTQVVLWPAKEVAGWSAAWDSAAKRLRQLDQGYDVWIDWYERRIKGYDEAFDIPGDKDRTEDKAILRRLADATDKDFWGKGATHVNTTLQSWIDEARIEAQIQEIIRKLRGGASAHYGAQDELDKRAALLAELDRMLGKPPQGRFGIGGNSPPESIDSPSAPIALPQDLRDPIEAISAELEKTEPDALRVAEQLSLMHRVGRKLQKMASIAGDEFAKTFGGELAKGAAKVVTRGVYLAIATPLIFKILDWLAPLIH